MRLTALALAALITTPALADEAWETNMGFITWEDTKGDDAILRLFMGEGDSGPVIRLVVPGLGADMMGGRGSYHGVWVASEAEVSCVTQMVDPMGGGATAHWGTFTLTFVGESFPSDFAGVYGDCLELPSMPIQARALVGEARNRAP